MITKYKDINYLNGSLGIINKAIELRSKNKSLKDNNQDYFNGFYSDVIESIENWQFRLQSSQLMNFNNINFPQDPNVLDFKPRIALKAEITRKRNIVLDWYPVYTKNPTQDNFEVATSQRLEVIKGMRDQIDFKYFFDSSYIGEVSNRLVMLHFKNFEDYNNTIPSESHDLIMIAVEYHLKNIAKVLQSHFDVVFTDWIQLSDNGNLYFKKLNDKQINEIGIDKLLTNS